MSYNNNLLAYTNGVLFLLFLIYYVFMIILFNIVDNRLTYQFSNENTFFCYYNL